jgi:hypothetical protein
MPFVLRLHEDHTTGLVAQCDVCGELIKDADLANICWDGFHDAQGEETGRHKDQPPIYYRWRIACKGHCTFTLDREFGHQFTQELETGIGYLMNNCQVDYKRMRSHMEALGRLGL